MICYKFNKPTIKWCIDHNDFDLLYKALKSNQFRVRLALSTALELNRIDAFNFILDKFPFNRHISSAFDILLEKRMISILGPRLKDRTVFYNEILGMIRIPKYHETWLFDAFTHAHFDSNDYVEILSTLEKTVFFRVPLNRKARRIRRWMAKLLDFGYITLDDIVKAGFDVPTLNFT